jgi:hypothetical protein
MPRTLLVGLLAVAAVVLSVAAILTTAAVPAHDPTTVASTPTAGVPAPQYPRASQKQPG